MKCGLRKASVERVRKEKAEAAEERQDEFKSLVFSRVQGSGIEVFAVARSQDSKQYILSP